MSKQATLYRMVLPDHVCPYGERAKALLEEHGYAVDDRLLTSREEVDSFKSERGLSTTPLVIIDGQAVGGSEELEAFLGEGAEATGGTGSAFPW